MDLAERFWSKVDKSGDCWLWTGTRSSFGYGAINVGTIDGKRKRNKRAHRVAYELAIGPIPPGLQLDHLCRVRHCVNPAHLEPVTALENQRRGMKATQTHCKHGHAFDEKNTYHTKAGLRMCKACARARAQARYIPATPEQLRRAHQASAAGRWRKWRLDRGLPPR